MTQAINLYEAKTNLSKLVERAAAGEEIIIAKAGRPLARLVSLKQSSKPRVPGQLKGRIFIAQTLTLPYPRILLRFFAGKQSEAASGYSHSALVAIQ
jgi:prevent-host-death family protein